MQDTLPAIDQSTGGRTALIRVRMQSGDNFTLVADNQAEPDQDLNLMAEAVVSGEMIQVPGVLFRPSRMDLAVVDYQ